MTDFRSVSIGELSLSFEKFGSGNHIVFCFHGHGRNPEDFRFLEKKDLTIISIALFHHGGSHFPEDRIEDNPLKRDEFMVLFQLILEVERVQVFDLVAFSQGGRFALLVFEDYFEKINSVYLISPDGMDSNSFYNRMSRRKWARKLFQRWENNPNRLVHYSKMAKTLRLMRPKVARFVENFAQDKSSFKRASLTWRGFRELRPDEVKLKEILVDFPGNFQIIMGAFDQLIRPKQAYDFAMRIGKPESVREIACSHNFFSSKNQKLLEEVILL